MRPTSFFSILVLISCLLACSRKPDTLLVLRSPEDTGLSFRNDITENDTFNILTDQYIYHGGGVAVADFNNDGLQDLFFTGNQVSNRLYINKGNLKFEDITDQANINNSGRWNSGVAVVDINSDGYKDIYVCATMKEDSIGRTNMLFINQGLDKDGNPTFVDKAKEYGIANSGWSLNAAFFDYDLDGDLDLYVLTNQDFGNAPTNYKSKIVDGSSPNTHHLYRNNGNESFTDVTREAGVTIEGFGLGLAISDFNSDGWPDMYVSNDFLPNDILYINKKNGTFENESPKLLGHHSQFSMGNDASDINNDGRTDIITLDMLPETNIRKKTTIGNKSYLTYVNNEKYGYEYQYTRNMLQLNNGAEKEIAFSEVGQLAGVYQTEWSWGALFADFDNDGLKDLVITNGFPKDITDKDFIVYRTTMRNVASADYFIDSIPVIKIANYAFKNAGDLQFKDVSKQWGFNHPSFSNGAAYADLDNDGDLDFVVNNINDPCSLYENTLYTSGKNQDVNNYLRFKLKGKSGNGSALGAKITLRYGSGKMQFQEHNVYRGYLSTIEDVIHFGLGDTKTVDTVFITWPDGKKQVLKNLPANQVMTLEYSSAAFLNDSTESFTDNVADPLFVESSRKHSILFKHQEQDKIDFNVQRTLPHKFSQQGPGLAVGDINGDQLDDFYVGGSAGVDGTLFIQQKNGETFTSLSFKEHDQKPYEDEGALFFDADNDGDQDLYVVSGSFEFQNGNSAYQDRLYTNDGKGNFQFIQDALPETKASGSCVRAADFDGDGDLDLFVGGRVVPGSYPYPAESYILRNDGGKFLNITESICPELVKPGLVTDALWTDFSNDGKVDLIIVGEFMPITFFKNEGNRLVPIRESGIESYSGWWNSITSGDFDKDGDMDYVAGNLGLNNSYQVSQQHPLKVFAKDFDKNESVDAILACYFKESFDNDEKKLFPVHFWEELATQSPKFRQQFSYYKQYGRATLDKLFTPEELKDALTLEANYMETSYIENLGNNKFRLQSLPKLVQVAPVNGILTDDFNSDGKLDVLMIGNDFGNEVFVGRHDALTGIVLLGNGAGNFTVMPSVESGFYVRGDAKALAKVQGVKNELYVSTVNRDSIKVYSYVNPNTNFFDPEKLDSWAEIAFPDGGKQKIEFYYGSGYLSQSSRKIKLQSGITEIIVHDSKGQSRKVSLTGNQ